MSACRAGRSPRAAGWAACAVAAASALLSACATPIKPGSIIADDGQLIYAANGRLSVQIVRVGRDQAAPGSADGFSSYFGRWQLVPAEGCIIHYQEGNLNVAQTGQAAKRYYSFDADGHLSLATPPRKVAGKSQPSPVFVWEKIP